MTPLCLIPLIILIEAGFCKQEKPRGIACLQACHILFDEQFVLWLQLHKMMIRSRWRNLECCTKNLSLTKRLIDKMSWMEFIVIVIESGHR